MKIQPFNCPKCGALIRVQGAKAKVTTCFQCGSLIDLVSEEKKLLGSTGARFPTRSAIALGKKANFEGIEALEPGLKVPAQVIGRVRFQMEGGTALDYWDEWCLISQKGEYLWLAEDEEGFSLQKAFVPLYPVNPTELPPGATGLTLEKESADIDEQGAAVVSYVEGELPWRATLGKRTGYLDASSGENTYSIEWSEEEIEFYKGREINPAEVYKAFGLKEAPLAWKAVLPAGRTHKAIVWSLVAFGLICILTFIWQLTTGSLINSKRFTLEEIDDTPGLLGPMELTATGRVYRVDMATYNLDQATNGLDILILDEAGHPIHYINGDFWDEVGYDDEGRWHESDTSQSAYFRLVRPGKYSFMVMGEGDARAKNTSFEVRLYQRVWPYWWSLTGWIVSWIYPIIFGITRLKRKGGGGDDDDDDGDGGNGDDD